MSVSVYVSCYISEFCRLNQGSCFHPQLLHYIFNVIVLIFKESRLQSLEPVGRREGKLLGQCLKAQRSQQLEDLQDVRASPCTMQAISILNICSLSFIMMLYYLSQSTAYKLVFLIIGCIIFKGQQRRP